MCALNRQLVKQLSQLWNLYSRTFSYINFWTNYSLSNIPQRLYAFCILFQFDSVTLAEHFLTEIDTNKMHSLEKWMFFFIFSVSCVRLCVPMGFHFRLDQVVLEAGTVKRVKVQCLLKNWRKIIKRIGRSERMEARQTRTRDLGTSAVPPLNADDHQHAAAASSHTLQFLWLESHL